MCVVEVDSESILACNSYNTDAFTAIPIRLSDQMWISIYGILVKEYVVYGPFG